MMLNTSLKSRVPIGLIARSLTLAIAIVLGAGMLGLTGAQAAPAQNDRVAGQSLVHLVGGKKHHKRKYGRHERYSSGKHKGIRHHGRIRKDHGRKVYGHKNYERRAHSDRDKHVERRHHKERRVIIYRDRYDGHGRPRHRSYGHNRAPRYAIGHRFPRHSGVYLRHPHEHGLAHPARGYGWYKLDRDIYLIALGTGLIVKALAN